MSSVVVTDKRGGHFQVVIHFTYGECDRLPYNALRKVNARIEQVPNNGIRAIADFNIRNKKEAANFVEILDLFGEEGSFIHGSGADATALAKTSPDEEEKEEDKWPTATAETQTTPSFESPSPTQKPLEPSRTIQTPPAKEERRNEAEDLEVEEEPPPPPAPAVAEWERAGDLALTESLAANEDRARTIARVTKAAGKEYTVDMIRRRLIRLLYHRFKDEAYVAAFMVRRGWKDVTKEEVTKVLAGN